MLKEIINKSLEERVQKIVYARGCQVHAQKINKERQQQQGIDLETVALFILLANSATGWMDEKMRKCENVSK